MVPSQEETALTSLMAAGCLIARLYHSKPRLSQSIHTQGHSCFEFLLESHAVGPFYGL